MIETSTFYDQRILNLLQEEQQEKMNELNKIIQELQEEIKILKKSYTRIYDL